MYVIMIECVIIVCVRLGLFGFLCMLRFGVSWCGDGASGRRPQASSG